FDRRVVPQHKMRNGIVSGKTHVCAAAQVDEAQATETAGHEFGINTVKSCAIADLDNIRRRSAERTELLVDDQAGDLRPQVAEGKKVAAFDVVRPADGRDRRLDAGDHSNRDENWLKSGNK